MQLFADPTFSVAVAFFVFIALTGKMAWRLITKGLDGRSARIAAELEEARALRAEAQAALEAYRKKHAQSLTEADAILTKARADAERLAANAQADLKHMLETRTRMAESKIAQAEKQAIDDVREHVVDITIAAAKAIILENIKDIPSDELIRKAISDIERKVH